MSVLPDEMRPVFEKLESLPSLTPQIVADALHQFHEKHNPLPAHVETATIAERFAFTLHTDSYGERSCWGSYFGPIFLSYQLDGTLTSHPLESLSPETFIYWTARATESSHPVLRARYADAAWELAPLVEGVTRDVSNATAAIDAYLAISATSFEVIPTIFELRRALNLALAVHDAGRVDRVVDQMFQLMDRGAAPSKIGTSVALFDSIFELRKKVKLSREREQRLVAMLETCLLSTAGEAGHSNVNHFAAQNYAERLVKYYRSIGSQADAVRVTQVMAGAIEKAAEAAEPMLATTWLQDAHLAYLQAGLQADADRVLLLLKQKGRESTGRMISHVVSESIPAEEVVALLNNITSGGLDACFTQIVTFFLPKSAKLRERLAEIKDKYPMSSLFPIALINDHQVVAHIGSIEHDEEGRLVHEIAQDMQFWTIFLMQALERMFIEHDLLGEQFVDLLYRTPLWGIERYQVLKNGMRHYRAGDFIAAIHVLVPQIEHALRMLLEAIERPTSMHNPKLNAYQEKDLGAILADTALRGLLGEDIGRYLRAILTDQRGWNLRNRLSHGLYDSHFFQRQIADRVVHILMLVSFFRPAGAQADAGAA